MTIDIPANERGLIRVFAVNRPPQDIVAAFKTTTGKQIAEDLLGRPLADNGIELFPVKDLSGVGLSGYLQEGYAVPAAQIAGHRQRLDALEGYVLLVFSDAFEGAATTLTPGPDVTLIGTFGEAQPDMSAIPLESAAAKVGSGTTPEAPPPAPRNRAGSLMVALALCALVVLAMLWGLF